MALLITNTVVMLTCMVALIGASAIPMWEYLSKSEKMAYLYNMFENQVNEFCNFSEMDDCKNELMKYGLRNLHQMPEDHLDTMDPYQRGANTLIWESMMQGHRVMQKKPSSTTTDPYDTYITDSNYLGSASSRQETVLSLTGNVVAPLSQRRPQRHYGPMVVRVHPDGRPVVEDRSKSLPVDDDVHHYDIVKTKVPFPYYRR